MTAPERPQGEARPAADRVGDLIRLAAPCAAVPREREERVRGIVRARWRSELRHRQTARRRWWIAAAAAALLLLAVPVLRRGAGDPAGHAPPAGEVVALVGDAWQREPSARGRTSALALGAHVPAGSEVATGPAGRAALRLPGGLTVRLDFDTRVRIASAGVWTFERGALYVDSPRGPASEAIEIRTAWGTVRDVGTQFEVRLGEDRSLVRVREGIVVVRTRAGAHEAGAGEQVEVDRGGGIARGKVSPHGAAWAWTESVTPMIDLEGTSARAFLEWASRERGLGLRFASASLAEGATRTILSGSVDGLTVEQALDVVLPTCEMAFRIDEGTMLIEPAGEDSR
jgi:ferric-dicitrate binding protein FerR (iron transport regulator)